MSAVWDRAADVMKGRAAILASIVLLFAWLPGLVSSALRVVALGAAAGTRSSGPPWLALVGLLVAAIGVIGHLALVAVASDPAVSRREAVAIALRRFWPYVGLALLLALAGAVLLAPLGVVLIRAYPSIAAMQAGAPPQLGGGSATFVLVYAVVLVALLVWVEARVLSVLAPVVVNERLGFASYARALRLTRGLTWRVVGVVLLFGLVAGVTLLAIRGVVGVALRLLFGFSGMTAGLFFTAAIVSLAACAFSVVAAAFTAQLYVATRNPSATT